MLEVARRDTKSKELINFNDAVEYIQQLLEEIQNNLLQKANTFRAENTKTVDSYEDFKAQIDGGGFFLAHWDGTAETEAKIKEETQATIRCIPLNVEPEAGTCMVTGKPSEQRVIFAKAY